MNNDRFKQVSYNGETFIVWNGDDRTPAQIYWEAHQTTMGYYCDTHENYVCSLN